MRTLLVAAMVMALAVTASGQMLSAGTSELKVEGGIDFDTSDGTLIDFGILYGMYIYDYLEGGLALRLTDSDSITVWRIGVFGQYDFDLGTELVPYLGAGLSLASYEATYDTVVVMADGTSVRSSEEESDNAIVLSGTAGVKFYIAENVAISTALVLEWASEDIYAEEDDFQDTDARIELGMRFFF